IADARLVSQVPAGVGEQGGSHVFAPKGFYERLYGLRKEGILGASGDHFVRIGTERHEHFGAVGRTQVRAAAADGELSLAGSAAVAQFLDDFRAESFHRAPASGLAG